MTFVGQAPSPPDLAAAQVLDDIAKACNDAENKKEADNLAAGGSKRTCQKLGQDKHKCCEEKIQEHRKKNPPDGKPPIRGEQAFQRPRFDNNGAPIQPVNATPVAVNRGQAISAAIASAGAGATRKAIGAAIGKALSGLVFPDASIVGPNGEQTFVDFKFACPASHRSGAKGYRPPTQSTGQAAAHNALGRATGGGQTLTIRF